MTWGPMLRIARRSVRRNLKRSILIAALIAVPIAGATVMDGLLRTLTGPEHSAHRSMGDADGAAEITGHATLPDWQPGVAPEYAEEPGARDPASVDLLGMLPPGSRVVRDREYQPLRLRAGERIVRTDLELFAAGDPLTGHLARLVSGRAPEGPNEALVTEPLAERLGLLGDDGDEVRRGATVTAENGPTVTVTGVTVNPYLLDTQAVVAPPGSVLTESTTASPPDGSLRFYVDLPPGANADDVWPALAEHGVAFTPRTVYTEPERYPAFIPVGGNVLETIGVVALVVGFGLLEVVLLAGAAFAVGARRQVRELGLIGANGGTARQLRRTVLAQGLFLGTIGSLAGLALGWVVLMAGSPVWQPLTGELVAGWRFGWVELTVAAVVGLLSGLAAALVPAIGVARMRPVDALAQRFRSTSLSARLPILGVALLGVGIVGVLGSGVLARRLVADHRAMLEASDTQFYGSPDLVLPTVGTLLGGLAAVVGVIMVTSGLLVALGRVGGRLPLSGRLAVRDAGRHRHRTVPAVAAIMIVVAGSVAMAFTLASSVADGIRTQPANTVIVNPDPLLTPAAAGAADTQLVDGKSEVAEELPGAVAHEITTVEDPAGSPEAAAAVALNPTDPQSGSCNGALIGVGTPEVIELASGRRPDAAVTSALAAGEVVALDECVLSGDTAMAQPYAEGAEPVRLTARYLEREEGTHYYDLPGAFVSAETAAAHGWTTRVTTLAVTYAETATQDDIDASLTAAEDNGLMAYVESDKAAEVGLLNLALAAGAALVTLLGVGITVALSTAESRADLATLAAIGAQPRRRRTLAGAQALVLSGLGTVLGLVIGGAFGFAAIPLTGETAFAVPWQHLAITAAVVPLLAVAVAMISTRAKLPMVRRME